VSLFIPDIVMEYSRRTFAPRDADVVRELDCGYAEGLDSLLMRKGGEERESGSV
jgi:hypothetical protein